MEQFGNKIVGIVKIFFTPAPVVSVLGDRHIMQSHHRYDLICEFST